MTDQDITIDRLLNKSLEVFTLAVELYNRPTIKYGAESCSIMLCNAWELMLKAHLIKEKGIESLYYNDKEDRTLSLSDCLKKVFTNDKDPLRKNMDILIDFRNTNTHFITDEYEIFMGPFIQASVANFAQKMQDFHNISVSDLMPEDRLALTVRKGYIQPETVRATYDPAVADLLLTKSKVASDAVQEGNDRTAIIYETTLRLVKKESDADINVFVNNSASTGIALVKDIKYSSDYYPFTTKGVIDEVKRRLKKDNINIYFKDECKEFNNHHMQLFIKVYTMKGDKSFAYDRKASNEPNSSWVYSQKTVDFIVQQLRENPKHCLDVLGGKQKKSKTKDTNPRGKGILGL